MRFFVLFVVTVTTGLYGAPAYSRLKTYTQNDGTTFKAMPKGDEYLHFIKTPQGDILLYNAKTKNYEYADIKNDRLVPSGEAYKIEKNTAAKQSAPYSRAKLSREALRKIREKRIRSFRRFTHDRTELPAQ